MGNSVSELQHEITPQNNTNEQTSFDHLIKLKDSTSLNQTCIAIQLSQIIKNEINYYESIISASRITNRVGALNSKLVSNPVRHWKRKPKEVNMDTTKKKRFIENDLPEMIKEYQLFMLNLSDQIKRGKIKDISGLNKLLDTFRLPLSIQLLWRCHLLHPAIYYKDCIKLFGFLLSPQISKQPNGHIITRCAEGNKIHHEIHDALEYNHDNASKRKETRTKAYNKWVKTWDKDIIYNPDKDDGAYFTQMDFNITLMKQIEFMTKVHCAVWKQNFENYLQDYIKKYICYLQTGSILLTQKGRFITKNKKFEFDALSPTFNIDLIWHTHMIYPYLYRRDCKNITNGIILDHDDTSVGDEHVEINYDNDIKIEKRSDIKQVQDVQDGDHTVIPTVAPWLQQESSGDSDRESFDDGTSRVKKKDSYWKYGKLGQFTFEHYVAVVLRDKYEFIINAFVRINFDSKTADHSYESHSRVVPPEIKSIIYDLFVDVEEEANKLPHPPLVQQDSARCKYGTQCCVGDHINFDSKKVKHPLWKRIPNLSTIPTPTYN